ncbi:hypothetical protein V865_006329 [Kwoniella europaea PYCC6329]|uniref:Uncharacterized protein n=1 Tax=Kwoniella europaea PYCC6329 TaxID=1423913 RepID=A0AAX4KPU1_9TREE
MAADQSSKPPKNNSVMSFKSTRRSKDETQGGSWMFSEEEKKADTSSTSANQISTDQTSGFTIDPRVKRDCTQDGGTLVQRIKKWWG